MHDKQATVSDPYQVGGSKILNTFLGATGIGAGGVGLHYLLKKLRKKKEEVLAKPSLEETAFDVTLPGLPKQAGIDPTTALLPLGGAGVGALIGAIRAKPGKRLQHALGGAGLGGAAGLGAAVLRNPTIQKDVGHLAARTGDYIPGLGTVFGAAVDKNPRTPGPRERANTTLAALLAGAGGLYLGGKATQALVDDNVQAKNRDEVASARDEYFKSLLNDNEKTSTALDNLYEVTTKQSSIVGSIARGIGNTGYNVMNAAALGGLDQLSEMARTGVGIASLGAAGLGAKYMYDKTTGNSRAKLLAAAAQARRRMQAVNTPWVDPVELAHVKHLVEQQGPATEQGR